MKKNRTFLGVIILVIGAIFIGKQIIEHPYDDDKISGEELVSQKRQSEDGGAGDFLSVSIASRENDDLVGIYEAGTKSSYDKFTLEPRTSDTTSVLMNAKLVIKIGEGLQFISYPQSKGESKIENYQYNYIDNTLTYWFSDGLSTTDLQPMIFVVGATELAGKVSNKLEIVATLTGNNASGESYEPGVSSSLDYTVSDVTYIKPDSTNVKFVNGDRRKMRLMPGGNAEIGEMRQNGPAVEFQDLTIEMSAKNAATEGLLRINNIYRAAPITYTGPQDSDSPDNRLVNTEFLPNTSQTNKIISNTGRMRMPSGVDAFFLYYYYITIPKDALPGTVYEIETAYFDSGELITTQILEITIESIKTNVDLTTFSQQEIAPGNGFLDVGATMSVSTSGKGISDLEITYSVPTGLVPESFSSNTSHTGSLVYYQYKGRSEWVLLSEQAGTASEKLAGMNGYIFYNVADREDIEKVRITVPKANAAYPQQFTPGVLKFNYKNAVAESTISVTIDSASYYDENEEKKVFVSHPSSLIAKVVDFSGKTTLETAGSNEIDSKSYVNGESFSFISSLSVGSYKPLKNPYKFLVLPKGVELNNNELIQLISITIGNQATRKFDGYNTASITAGNNYEYEKRTLKDGSSLYFWLANDEMSRVFPNFSGIWKQQVDIKIRTANEGTYSIISGGGDLHSDDILSSTQASISDLGTDIQSELKTLGVTSSLYSLNEKTLKIDKMDYLELLSKTKLTTEDNYVDVTSPSATMITVPGQAVDYQVTIHNAGTTEMKDVSIIDILPYLNDTNILSNTPRLSDFRLYLTGPVADVEKNGEILKGSLYNIEYSQSKTPTRWNLQGQKVPGDEWGELPPSITDVQAFKLNLEESLAPGDSVKLYFKMQVPADAPRSSGVQSYQAFNTIAYHSSSSSSESNRVRVQTKEPGSLDISGTVFVNQEIDGILNETAMRFDSQRVVLYQKNGDKYDYVSERQTTEANGNKGFYLFNEELINGETYKVGVDFTELIEAGYTPLELSNKFASVKLDKPNAEGETIGWLLLDGREEFIVSDKAITGHAPVYELNAPVFKATPLETFVAYQYFNQSISKKKALPSKGMKVALQLADGTPVKGNDNKELVATVGDYGKASFGSIPLAVNTAYQLAYPDGRVYKVTYMNDQNEATVTYDKVSQPADFKTHESGGSETATLGFTSVTPGESIVATVYTTAYDVLRFGDVSDTLEFGTNGILPLSMFNEKTSPQPFKLEVEDTRVVKNEDDQNDGKWKVSATIATDLQAVENDQVVATLPGVLGYAKTTSGTTTFDALQPNVPYVIHEVTGIQEGDADNTVNIPKDWTDKSGLVLNIPAGTPKLKTYSTEITWTLTASPY